MLKCRPVGCPSIKPCASIVASFGFDRDPALEAPFRRPAVRPLAPWVLVENVLEYLLEIFVGLKLVLDLGEDFLR
jgi:hypothetical protein